MTSINTAKVPLALKCRDHWVLWKGETVNGRPTKIPYYASGGLHRASSVDRKTWTGLFRANGLAKEHHMAGVGFCFQDSGLTGIDFDGCRDRETEKIDDWALAWLKKLNSYSEVSPS